MHFFNFISTGGALLLLLLSPSLRAQEDWEPAVREKYALLQDHCNSENYKDAYPAYQWLKNEKPDLHENLYIFGSKVLRELCIGENEEIKKASLFGELSEVYDLRMKYFGDSNKLIIRKALDLYSVKLRDPSPLELTSFDNAFDWNDGAISSHILTAYMHVISNSFKAGLITEDGVINRYLKIKDSFGSLATADGENENLQKHQAICDNLFMNMIKMDCDGIKEKFADTFDPQSGNAVDLAKIIVRLSLAYKCTDESYFVKALDVYYQSEPTYAMASFLGNKMKEKGDTNLADKYYNDMVMLSANDDQKAKANLVLASLYFSENKIRSRSYLRKALEASPDMKDAYVMWGDLYFYSFKECKKEISQVEDRLPYLAAYEKYRKAGENEKMLHASRQFPAIDDIHLENYQEGEKIKCECWINEEVTLRKRPRE